MSETLSTLLAIAANAARCAGQALLAHSPDWLSLDADFGRDIKLAADRQSEATLAAALAPAGLPIFSEESGWIVPRRDGEDYWIVDPLDGTLNYARAVPIACSSVALMSQDRPVLGVVYDFNRDELFSGGGVMGAFLNDRPIAVSTKPTKQTAVLATGLAVRGDYSDEAMLEFAREIRQWKKARMIGSAALSLAYVAAGRFDAYRERSIMLWDVAAGWALVEAAGGRVRATVGNPEDPVDIVAANPALLPG